MYVFLWMYGNVSVAYPRCVNFTIYDCVHHKHMNYNMLGIVSIMKVYHYIYEIRVLFLTTSIGEKPTWWELLYICKDFFLTA